MQIPISTPANHQYSLPSTLSAGISDDVPVLQTRNGYLVPDTHQQEWVKRSSGSLG